MTPFNVAIVKWIRGAFDFRGRSTRADYWWPRLLVFVVNATLLSLFIGGGGLEWIEGFIEWSESDSVDFSDFDAPPLTSLSRFAGVFVMVFGLLTFIPDIAVSWRRFHDLGQPGWLHALFLIGGAFLPFAALAQYIWFAFPGQRHDNRYGPDPLDDRADIFG